MTYKDLLRDLKCLRLNRDLFNTETLKIISFVSSLVVYIILLFMFF